MEELSNQLKSVLVSGETSNITLESTKNPKLKKEKTSVNNNSESGTENGHTNGSSSPNTSNQTSEESTEISEISLATTSEICLKSDEFLKGPIDHSSAKTTMPSAEIIKNTIDQMKRLESELVEMSREMPDGSEQKVQILYKVYRSELEMPDIMRLIQKDLSEPYSIYTYRYFIHNWPHLCYLAMHEGKCIGAIVCKLDLHRDLKRGYIAMLAVDKEYRKLKIGTTLVQKAIRVMINYNADEVVLETEITNQPALKLYENLGFVRDKRLFHYYLNGVDALRLKLWFR
ncbi:unnamed protein product [Diamesa serratosioi]